MFCCAYCRVRLFLLTGDFFRYYIPPAEDVRGEIFYVPYWRFKGLYYAVLPLEVAGKALDQTFLSAGRGFFPANLGFRPQALTLRFASPELTGRFLPSKVPLRDVFTVAEGHPSVRTGPRAFHRAFIGKTASMIYAPVYLDDGVVHDAVLKRPVSSRAAAIREELDSAGPQTGWSVGFLSTLCPECGWQLTGENESAVFICGNCVSVWEISGTDLKRVKFIVSPGGQHGLFYAPFWRVSVVAEGVELNTYADLVRFANLPRTVKREWEQQELYFWLPAFRTNPDWFLRLAALLTATQPQIVNDDRRIWTSRESFAAITLAAGEAASGRKAALAKLTLKRHYPMLPDVELSLKSAALVLLPFKRNGAEFIEVNLNFRLPGQMFPQRSTSR